MTHKPVTGHRKLEGTVVSAKANKTRVVLVSRTMVHPRYGKRYELSHRYPVHDEANTTQLGDRVAIEECRPYSRTKRWRIIRVLDS